MHYFLYSKDTAYVGYQNHAMTETRCKDDGLGGPSMSQTVDFYVKDVVAIWTEQNQNGTVAGALTSPRNLERPCKVAYRRIIGKKQNACCIKSICGEP